MTLSIILTLEDYADSISFIDDSTNTFQLLDGTFECPVPDADVVEYTASTAPTNSVLSRNYKNRTLTFSYRVKSSTRQGVLTAVNRIYKMLFRAQTRRGLAGGGTSINTGYNVAYTSSPYTKTSITGDHGLVVTVRLGETSGGTYTDERGQAQTKNDTYTFNVLYGDQEITNPIAVTGFGQKNAEYFISEIKLALTCLPFATSNPLRYTAVTRSDAIPYPFNAVSDASQRNVSFVNDSSVLGTVDALTRTSMLLTSANGVLMGVDSGDSIWATPSVMLNTTKSNALVSEVVPCGKNLVLAQHLIAIKLITLNPVTYQASIDGGAYGGTVTPVANVKSVISLPNSESVSLVFNTLNFSTPSYTANDVLAFATHQSALSRYIGGTGPGTVGAYDVYANRAAAKLEAGVSVYEHAILVQPGITGKYKLYAQINNVSALVQYSLAVSTIGFANTSVVSRTAWSKPRSANSLVELGVIDLTPSGALPIGHPDGIQILQYRIYMRLSFNPVAGDTMNVPICYLVPCSEDSSYLCGGWSDISSGYVVMSNFDSQNPKIYKTLYDYTALTTANIGGSILQLDETHAGDIVTVFPETRNAIMVVPLYESGSSDYRSHSVTASGYVSSVKVAIKPRYLFIG
jgi:hypothetical protein